MTIMGLIQEMLTRYRSLVTAQRGTAAVAAEAAAAAAARAPTAPPLRAGLRSAKDPKLPLAYAMGDLKEEAEDLK